MILCSASVSVQYNNIFSPFNGDDWKEGFRWVGESGFNGVEVILADPNLLSAKAILKEAEKHGLSISTVSTGQAAVMEGLSMVSPSEAVREYTMKRLRDDVDFSAALGGPNVTIGLIRGAGGVLDPVIEREFLKREFIKIAEYACKKGVKLNFEPINRYEVKLINTTEDGVQFLKEIGEPENVGILYDTFHSNIEDDNMFNVIEQYGKYISHIHFADSNRRLPGDGHVDFKRIVSILKKNKFDGYVSLEILNVPDRQYVTDNARVRMREILIDN